MRRCLIIVAVAAMCITAYADLQQPAPASSMQVVLEPDGKTTVLESRRMLPRAPGETGARSVAVTFGDARIVPGSLQLVLPDGVEIERQYIPAGMKNGFIWELSGQARDDESITLAYELQGLEWTLHYTLVYDRDGKAAALQANIELTNNSHMDLQNAAVTLDLGEIPVSDGSDDRLARFDLLPRSLQLRDGWTKTVRLTRGESTTLLSDLWASIIHRYEPDGSRRGVHRLLVLDVAREAPERALLAAMPKGPMSVYLVNDGHGDEFPAAVTECDFPTVAQTQDQQRLSVDLGADRDVYVHREKLTYEKTNLDFDRIGRVSGSDVKETWRLQVRNSTRHHITIEILQEMLDNWEITAKQSPEMMDEYTALWTAEMAPGEDQTITYTIIKHEGTRAD